MLPDDNNNDSNDDWYLMVTKMKPTETKCTKCTNCYIKVYIILTKTYLDGFSIRSDIRKQYYN